MSVTDDLVLLSIVIAIAGVVILGFLVALYIWALARRREMDEAEEEVTPRQGPFDTP